MWNLFINEENIGIYIRPKETKKENIQYCKRMILIFYVKLILQTHDANLQTCGQPYIEEK